MALTSVIRMVTSIGIGVLGTFTNLFSLTYFFRNDSRSVGSRLLILLNSFDLLVCISATGVTVFYNLFNATTGHTKVRLDHTQEFCKLLFRISTQCTGFTTCLLSITRTISFIKPFYRVNQVAIAFSSAIHASLIAIIETTVIVLYWVKSDNFYLAMDTMNYIELFVMSLIFVLVVVSNIFSVAKLKISQRNRERVAGINKRATITVFILSILFCFFNVTFIATYYCFLLKIEVNDTFFWIAMFLALPLNSASNPLVYILRKEHMRVYIRREFNRVTSRYGQMQKTHTVLSRGTSVL